MLKLLYAKRNLRKHWTNENYSTHHNQKRRLHTTEQIQIMVHENLSTDFQRNTD